MKKVALISLLTLTMMVFGAGGGLAAEMVTIQGQVTEDNQLMDEEGNVFVIAETEEGMQVMDMVGQKIEVRGTLTEEEGVKEITVESYSVIE